MISIIITAYKEARTIGRAIESIVTQRMPERYELIIVAPDKETLSKAKEYAKQFKQIRLIKDNAEGKPSALNIAFSQAKGRILIFTDGDVYIGKDSIRLILREFKNPAVGAVSGRPVSRNNRKTMFGFWSHLLSDIADARRKKAIRFGKKIFCSGYLYSIKGGMIKAIPKETLSEDGLISYLIHEAGYKINYSSEARVFVKYPTRFREWIIQKKRSVGGYNQIRRWTGKEIRSIRKESSGIFDVLEYPKNPKEVFYTFFLLLARLYLWLVIFIDINLRKKKLKRIWLRAKTTK